MKSKQWFFFVAQLVFLGKSRSVRKYVATVYVVHHRFWTSTLEFAPSMVKGWWVLVFKESQNRIWIPRIPLGGGSNESNEG